MLKLLKYEIKQTWKMCITFLGIMLLGCLGLIFNPFNEYFMLSFFYTILLVIVVMGVSIALFFYCMGSFNQEFTQPQSYLIMTLPVKTRDFIGAKFLNQLFWNLIGVHIIMVAIYYGNSLYGKVNLLPFQLADIATGDLFKLYINGIASYILMVLIGYFSIAIFSTQTRINSQTLKKVVLSIGIAYVIGTLINLLSFMVPYAIQYNLSRQMIDISRLRDYIQTDAYNLKFVNTAMKLIASYLFYKATKYIIEEKVQI